MTSVVAGARQSRAGIGGSCDGFVVREVYPVVLGKARMQGEIVHASLASVDDLRYPGDGFRIELTVTHDPQPAGSFRDQDVAVGKESESIRVAEPEQRDDAEFRPRDQIGRAACRERVE